MKRILLIGLVAVVGIGALAFGIGAGNNDGVYRVRAIFDNANQVTVGEEARVAGVTIGVIETLDVTDDNKAAVTLRIDNPGYQDFRSDAHCIIRPQSLIGEQFVDCSPTRPRQAGQPEAPPLQQISSGPGEGDYLLPVENTSSPVGIDLINNIMRVPQRQRFALILNEFGTALAGNGRALNQAIRRANPALQETDKVLATLASQNKTLATLAVQSDQILTPLARDRKQVASFINSANATGAATAAKGAELQANFQRFPAFLTRLTPTMNSLASFSNAFAGFLKPLSGSNIPQINSIVETAPAFLNSSTNALTSLGTTAVVGRTALLASAAEIAKTKTLSTKLVPFASDFGSLLGSLQKTGGWEFLMQTLYFTSANYNGFNKYGHYLRTEILTYPGQCVLPLDYREELYYSVCSANFDGGITPLAATASKSAARRGTSGLKSLAAGLAGLTGTALPSVTPKNMTPTPLPEVTRPAPTTTTTETQPTTTQPAEPAAKSGASTANSANLLRYLIGGKQR